MEATLTTYVTEQLIEESRPYLAVKHGSLSDGKGIDVLLLDPFTQKTLQASLQHRQILVVLKPTLLFVDPLRSPMLERVYAENE